MEERKTSDSTYRWVNTRLDEEQYRKAQEVAERLYEGNVSMLLRAALKEFVQSQQVSEQVAVPA